MAKSSATYENKTTFAQQKYLRRKVFPFFSLSPFFFSKLSFLFSSLQMRKYVKTVQVLRPTAAVVAQSYFSKAPQKILGLRFLLIFFFSFHFIIIIIILPHLIYYPQQHSLPIIPPFLNSLPPPPLSLFSPQSRHSCSNDYPR